MHTDDKHTVDEYTTTIFNYIVSIADGFDCHWRIYKTSGSESLLQCYNNDHGWKTLVKEYAKVFTLIEFAGHGVSMYVELDMVFDDVVVRNRILAEMTNRHGLQYVN